MEDVVDAAHGVAHALQIAYISDKEAHLARKLGSALLQEVAHVILLLFVTRKDANLADVRGEEVLEHGVTETPRAAGDHEGFIRKLI